MKKVILSVTNDLSTDQRMHRICTSLHNHGFEVCLIGRKRRNSIKINRIYQTKRINLFFTKGFFFYAEYNIRLFFILVFSKASIFVSNDLDTLLANFLASKIRTKKLVYDSHEFFTEVPELIERKNVKKIWEYLERKILPTIQHSYTVSESIADIYSKKYKIEMKVIRNLPSKKQEIIIPPYPISIQSKNTIIYQGVLNIGRGIETVIDAMKYLEDTTFLIVGTGDIDNELKKRVSDYKLENKILFTGKVALEYLPYYTNLAQLGISLEENRGLNYYYALPNKLFSYIQAGIPVLVADLPEMKKIVTNYKIGEIASSIDSEKLAFQIKEMLSNTDKQKKWQQQLISAANELCWEIEEKKLIDIYTNIK